MAATHRLSSRVCPAPGPSCQLSSFGVAASGELYAVALDGTVRKFVAGS